MGDEGDEGVRWGEGVGRWGGLDLDGVLESGPGGGVVDEVEIERESS